MVFMVFVFLAEKLWPIKEGDYEGLTKIRFSYLKIGDKATG